MEESLQTARGSLISLPYGVLRKVDIERRSEERRAGKQRHSERRLLANRRNGKRKTTIEELRHHLQSRGVDDSQVTPYSVAPAAREVSRERRNNGRRIKERRAAERRRQERRSASGNHLKRSFMVRTRSTNARAPYPASLSPDQQPEFLSIAHSRTL